MWSGTGDVYLINISLKISDVPIILHSIEMNLGFCEISCDLNRESSVSGSMYDCTRANCVIWALFCVNLSLATMIILSLGRLLLQSALYLNKHFVQIFTAHSISSSCQTDVYAHQCTEDKWRQHAHFDTNDGKNKIQTIIRYVRYDMYDFV